MNNGARPQRLGWNDFDFLKTFHPQIYAGTVVGSPEFPSEFLTDGTEWFPNQDAEGEPNGCTNYSQTKLARILGKTDAVPAQLEAVTHANAKGGYPILGSVDAARTVLKWFSWRYVIQAKGNLDYFDASRLAQVSGLPEHRAISAGSPWFSSWEQSALSGNKILPMPTQAELSQAHSNPNSLPWHNYVLDGWSQNFPVSKGQLLYRVESHQGESVDYLYMPRDVLNVVFDLYGTVEVVVTNQDVLPSKVPLPDWFWSLWHSWLGFQY